MAVHRLAELTWEQVRDLDRARVVAILPVGAVEAHGPHLPISTDLIIAEAMAERGARKLAARGLEPLVMPTLSYTAAGFAAAFPGTVSVRPETVAATVLDIATSMHRAGFGTLAVANAHLDPAHTGALASVAEALNEGGLMRFIFPDVTRRPWALRLTDEFRSGACHAGRYEGSVVMAVSPGLVREEIRTALEPNPASLPVAIGEGKSTFAEAGGPRAYFGWPAESTAAEGEATIETLGKILEEAVMEEFADD